MLVIRNWLVFAAVAAMLALLVAPLVVSAVKQMRKIGAIFCIIAAAFVYASGTKPLSQKITWDGYLTDNGSAYAPGRSANIKWRKTDQRVPDDETVYVYKRLGTSGPWTMHNDQNDVESGGFIWSDADITNYWWYIYTAWMPPQPVHTNGVWVGNVIERAQQPTNGMVAVGCCVEENGVKIAPGARE